MQPVIVSPPVRTAAPVVETSTMWFDDVPDWVIARLLIVIAEQFANVRVIPVPPLIVACPVP